MDDDCSWHRRSSHALTMGQYLDVKRYDDGYVFDIWALFKTLATSCDSCYPGWPDNMAPLERRVKILTCVKVVYNFPKKANKQASKQAGFWRLFVGLVVMSHECLLHIRTHRVPLSKHFQYKETVYICTSNVLGGCKWDCCISNYFKMNMYGRSDQVHNDLATWIKGMVVDSLSIPKLSFGGSTALHYLHWCTCAGRSVKVIILPVVGYMLQAPTSPDSLLPQMRWFDVYRKWCFTTWRFQPIWFFSLVKLDHFHQVRGFTIKKIVETRGLQCAW